MSETPAFLDSGRPAVPDLVVPRAILPFWLPRRPVRGRLVRLGPLADALLSRHDNHPAVSALAGEMLALVAALAAALKYRGSFSVQAKGDGPVGMLLADCTETGELRCYARVDADKLDRLLVGDPAPSAAALLGRGVIAFTADQGPDMDRYQGIVEISGLTLADMTRHYFASSEQFPCELRLASRRTAAGWRAGALVLERVAGEGGVDPALDAAAQEDAWHTATTLAATLGDDELLDDALPSERLLYRLFGSEGVAADRARALAFGCRCSRQRLAQILETFDADDLDHMIVGSDIVMTCEFCNHDFRFGRDEVRGRTVQDRPRERRERP
jgi:molecular chaperone Hsp33